MITKKKQTCEQDTQVDQVTCKYTDRHSAYLCFFALQPMMKRKQNVSKLFFKLKNTPETYRK